jgi:hypothetical protein
MAGSVTPLPEFQSKVLWWLMGLVTLSSAGGVAKLITVAERQIDIRARLQSVERTVGRIENALPGMVEGLEQTNELIKALAAENASARLRQVPRHGGTRDRRDGDSSGFRPSRDTDGQPTGGQKR